jgi:hypothetical protein
MKRFSEEKNKAVGFLEAGPISSDPSGVNPAARQTDGTNPRVIVHGSPTVIDLVLFLSNREGWLGRHHHGNGRQFGLNSGGSSYSQAALIQRLARPIHHSHRPSQRTNAVRPRLHVRCTFCFCAAPLGFLLVSATGHLLAEKPPWSAGR